jgi:23S rRNA pseudouridine2605 synthase
MTDSNDADEGEHDRPGSRRNPDERPPSGRRAARDPWSTGRDGTGDDRSLRDASALLSDREERAVAERKLGKDRPRRENGVRPKPPTGEPARSGAAPPPDPSEPAEERIAKVIARAGIASRRDAEAMIAEGRVTLNGEPVTSPALNVAAGAAITVDGEPLPVRERTRLWIFHKPRGLVTTARDPQGRPTVFESLPPDLPRVVAIGRLDINTEGLLLLTNDGGLARVIAHPETGWLRRYKVRAHGDVTQAALDGLRGGITLDGMEYGPVEATLDRVQGDNTWITLGLREGKNREVKRILEHLGLQVNRLIRLSFGPFQLGDLEPGLVEEVRTKVCASSSATARNRSRGRFREQGARADRALRQPQDAGSAREGAGSARRRGARPGAAPERSRRPAPPDRRPPLPSARGRPTAVARCPAPVVWRDDDEEPRSGAKAPRRGADPVRRAPRRPSVRGSASAPSLAVKAGRWWSSGWWAARRRMPATGAEDTAASARRAGRRRSTAPPAGRSEWNRQRFEGGRHFAKGCSFPNPLIPPPSPTTAASPSNRPSQKGWLRRYKVLAPTATFRKSSLTVCATASRSARWTTPCEATLDRVQGDNLGSRSACARARTGKSKRILEH